MAVLLRLLRLLRPYRAGVAITAAAAIGLMACSVTLPYLTGVVVDEVLRAGREGILLPLIAAYLGIVTVRALLAHVRRRVSGNVSLGVEVGMRARMFNHLSRLSFGFFDRMPVGQVMSRATSDLQTVRFFLGYGLIFLFMHVFTLVLVSVILFLIHPGLAALSLATGPILFAVAWRYSRLSNPILVDVQQRVGEVTELAEESAVGIRVIKAFGRERELSERFEDRSRAAFERSMDANRLQSFYQPLMGFLPVTLGLATVLAVGGTLVIDGAMTLGELTSFYLYLTMLMFPFRSVGDAGRQRPARDRRRAAHLRGARCRAGRDRAPRCETAAGRWRTGAVRRGRVRVRARWSGGPEWRRPRTGLGRDAGGDRRYRLGQEHAGEPGAALPRPHRRTRADGRSGPARPAPGRSAPSGRRRRAGAVPLLRDDPRQHRLRPPPTRTGTPCAGSPRWPGPTTSSTPLPDGYETVVGERGFTLSGGQRQRIAIARAILTDPRVLILDEATASVDASTEREIQEALRAAMRGRTTIVIAHRHSTIALADRIAVLERGRLAALGTHGDLVETSPLYRGIYESGLARPELLAPES